MKFVLWGLTQKSVGSETLCRSSGNIVTHLVRIVVTHVSPRADWISGVCSEKGTVKVDPTHDFVDKYNLNTQTVVSKLSFPSTLEKNQDEMSGSLMLIVLRILLSEPLICMHFSNPFRSGITQCNSGGMKYLRGQKYRLNS